MPTQPEDRISHDQAIKQLLADMTSESLAFFAGEEGRRLPVGTKFTLLKQEQISPRLGKGHREADTIVLAQLPDGSEEAIVFLVEGEAIPSREAVYKIAEYLLLVAQGFERDRANVEIVPVMVVVGEGQLNPKIRAGTKREDHLLFECEVTQLASMDAEAALTSGNLAAAINVMNMKYTGDRRVAILAAALALLAHMESPIRKRKYADYMMRCARLVPAERVELNERLSEDAVMIETLFTDYEKRGLEKGLALGKAEGEASGKASGEASGRAALLLRLLDRRGLAPTPAQQRRIRRSSNVAELERWFDAALTARTVREVFTAQRGEAGS